MCIATSDRRRHIRKTKTQQQAQIVTADNVPRAETDLSVSAVVKKGGFGPFEHDHQPTPIDKAWTLPDGREGQLNRPRKQN
jgi:hypothetical protein